MRRFLLLLLIALVAAPAAGAATYNATPSTFASVLTGAADGDTILLATGDYGTFTGTSKAVLIKADAGAAPTMVLDFGTGDGNFTVEGLSVPGGDIANGAHDITVKGSTFSAALTLNGLANSNVVIDGDQFLNIDAGGSPARVHLNYSSSTPSGVTIKNSLFQGGDADGIQAGVAFTAIDNRFIDIIESGPNHTDGIQLYGATDSVIRGNYFRHTSTGIVAYDGTSGNLIEDNVIDLTQLGAQRPWAIELYSDNGSVVRHNTLRYAASCSFSEPCGSIALDRKSANAAGSGTQVYDNIATEIQTSNGSTTGRNDHNLVRANAGVGNVVGTPVFVDSSPTTYAGFALAAGSPGKNAASDGLDAGIRTDHQPVAAFTASPEPSVTGQAVSFDATGSTCADTPCTYAWEDDGPDGPGGAQYALGTGQTMSFTFVNPGTKYVRLTVTDADGDIATVEHDHVVSTATSSGPTFVWHDETTWTSTDPSKSITYSVAAGDVIVAYGMTEDQGTGITISGGGTWTQRQAVNVSAYARAYAWTATAASSGSVTTTCTRTGSSGAYGCAVSVFRGSSGVGASAKANGTGAPSLALTTTAASSAVVVADADWNAADGASRVWRTGAGAFTELTYASVLGAFTGYGGYHPNVGAAGAKTVGLSAPASQKYSIVAVEVKL